jgi:hypothetical protein
MAIFTRKFIQQNQVNIAILLFIFLFGWIHFMKPSIIYLPNGSYRSFGVGYTHKTVFPIWIVAIVLGIFSYLLVRYYCLNY